MSLEQVIKVLENTVRGDQRQITEATQALEQAREANFGQLLQTLAVVLSTEQASSESRRQAALFIKNSISGGSQQFKEKNAEKWRALDPKIRESVKGHVLNTLVTKDYLVGNQTAQALAALAMLELPRGQWPDLIRNLCGACDAKNADELKESALKTLGYICKEIDEAQVSDSLSMILTAVVNNMMAKSNRVRRSALEALQNMVYFLNTVFQVKQQRDILMTVVFQNCNSDDDDMKTMSLSLLSDIILEYYQYMAEYMEAVFRLTIPIIEQCKEDEEVVKQAIDIWINIADIETEKALNEEDAAKSGAVIEEVEKSRRYTEGAMNPLLKALFVPLSKQDPDAEDDEWNVSHAAATCISFAATCVREKIVPSVLQLFTQNVMSDQWRVRDAATVAFGSILDGPPTESLKPYLSDASLLNLFLDHMKDTNPVVRGSTAWTLGRMCELHVDVVVTDAQRFEAVYNAFKQGLEDEPNVATMCTWGLMVLTEALDDYITRSSIKVPNPLVGHFTDLVQALFSSGEKRGCSARQRKGTYQALGALVHCSTPECLPQVAQVTVMCLERINTMTSVQTPPDKKDADELEALVSGLMSECVNKLEGKVVDIADRVCSAYLVLFQKGHGASAQEEAVLGFGSFASAMGKGVERYANHIANVLKECIAKPDELDVCKAALGSLGDLARALEEKFAPFVSVFVPMLFPLLSPEHNRSIFSPVLEAFGDIAQYATKDFAAYIPQIINVVQQAMASRVDLSDDDEKDFLFELQESCFACIAGIQSGLTTLHSSQTILPYSGSITQCIQIAYNNMMRPESLSSAIVGAICDLVIAAGPRVKEAMAPNMPWAVFPSMVKAIEQSAEDSMTKDNCKYAQEQMMRFMQS